MEDCFRVKPACLLVMFLSHDIVLHTKYDVQVFPVLLFLINLAWFGTLHQNLKFKAIKLCDFKMDLIKW